MNSLTMKQPLRIGILHYHFRRGGVRTVVANALRALIAYGSCSPLEIDIISCDALQQAGSSLAAELHSCIREHKKSGVVIRQIEIPALAYNQRPATNRQALFQEAHKIKQAILERINLRQNTTDNPYILHVHNANLGKNPYLTLAIKLLSEQMEQENLPAWLLYQMHDFAEDNRPACWQALRDCSGKPDAALAVEMMYPVTSRVQWAAINSADRDLLLQMGLPVAQVFILPNCIDTDAFRSSALADLAPSQLAGMDLEPMDFKSDLLQRISVYARKQGYCFDRHRKIILAPIKTIRRKNVAESILALLALNQHRDEYQLLVTLPAYSREDMLYCRALETFIKVNHLPVVIGFGAEHISGIRRIIRKGRVQSYSMVDILNLSNAVITTSIQEGFGYVFHEPWLADRAVFGRNLHHVTRDFKARGLNLSHLYDHLLLPWSWLEDDWRRICTAYVSKIKSLYHVIGQRPPVSADLQQAIEEHKIFYLNQNSSSKIKYFDWADIDLDSQLLILDMLIKKPNWIAQIKWTDHHLRETSLWYPQSFSGIIAHNKKVVDTIYSLSNQAGQLAQIYTEGTKFMNSARRHSPAASVTNEPVFRRMLEVPKLHLLA